MRTALCSILAMTALVLIPAIANAKTERETTYRSSLMWSSAVRFIRVDQGCRILEKDKDTGYLLFEYEEAGTKYNSSLELINVEKDNKRYTRTIFRIEGLPMYFESVLLDKFFRKLKEEYGPPPQPSIVAPPASVVTKNISDGKKARTDKSIDEEDKDESDLEVNEKDIENGSEEND